MSSLSTRPILTSGECVKSVTFLFLLLFGEMKEKFSPTDYSGQLFNQHSCYTKDSLGHRSTSYYLNLILIFHSNFKSCPVMNTLKCHYVC